MQTPSTKLKMSDRSLLLIVSELVVSVLFIMHQTLPSFCILDTDMRKKKENERYCLAKNITTNNGFILFHLLKII